MKAGATNGNGEPINPEMGSVSIMKEVEKGKLSIIGTGFYITRYGLFLTAAHVLSDLMDKKNQRIIKSFICHLGEENKVHLRRIKAINLFDGIDMAVGQADNYMEKYPNNPLMNIRSDLGNQIAQKEDALVTYAYPENKVLDFIQKQNIPIVKGDYYRGKCLEYVTESEHPYIPYLHYETSIHIKSGASGGPVFHNKKVIGINCRGWDFGEGEDALSYVVPVALGFGYEVGGLEIPEISWEYKQIPTAKRNKTKFTLSELIEFGHIQI